MSNQSPIPSPDAGLVRPSTQENRVLPVVLSVLVPGTGHLLLGQRRRGWVLFVLFLVLMCCIWPLRLPRFVLVMNLIALIWLVLSLHAGFSTFLSQNAISERKLSKLWLLAVSALALIWIKLLLTPLLLLSGFQVLEFNSSSMQSTLVKGDQFIADKDYYRHRAVARGDLIVLRKKDFLTVKRVIALAGDTISGEKRNILLNGQPITEPFIQHTLSPGSNPELDTFGPFTIPTGKYFVMGDNRDVSFDSRRPDFGLLDAADIVGKPLYIYGFLKRGRTSRKLR